MLLIPALQRESTAKARGVVLPRGSNGFGVLAVNGIRRDPFPPARIIPP
jgi:hypothetical protein